MTVPQPGAPLLPGVSQYDVDFVIPRVGVDLPLGIDPFLLYKSRNPNYRELHSLLVRTFNAGIDAIRRNRVTEARALFDFPEVAAVGLGYTQGGRRGSGVGTHLSNLIIDTVRSSPALMERGVRHVEEMQLLSAGIGPDRISDISANVLKRFLVEYTQRQCKIWEIPVERGVPLEHVFEPASRSWVDSYEDLPISTADGLPILLVPRRLVRLLPWINYDNFLRTEFSAYLAARRVRGHQGEIADNSDTNLKDNVVSVTRSDIGWLNVTSSRANNRQLRLSLHWTISMRTRARRPSVSGRNSQMCP